MVYPRGMTQLNVVDVQRGATLVQHCNVPIRLPQGQRQTDMGTLVPGKGTGEQLKRLEGT
jgi:hypothetical protein